jgi:DNA polymerase III sliding clamp (beta) subunit (PCNA family)
VAFRLRQVFSGRSSGGGGLPGDAELRADIQGPKQELVFNAKYILDGLSNINTSRVCLMLNNGSGPVVMRGVNEGSDLVLENLLYIAMPINN